MKQRFKTNINCGSCIRSVTNFINDIPDVEEWDVDTDNPDKILTVSGIVTTEAIIEAVEEAGFNIKEI